VDDPLVAHRHRLDADHARAGAQGVARVARVREADVDVREVRDRLLAHIVDAERDAQVEEQERAHRAIPEPHRAGSDPAGVGRERVLERGGEEGEHALVDRHVPRVRVDGAGREIVEAAAVSVRKDHRAARAWHTPARGGGFS
jgi:hypothetical protein